MENKIVKKNDDHEIVFEWENTEHVNCSIHMNNPSLEKCFFILAEELGVSLCIELSETAKSQKQMMADLGELFAQMVCQRCNEVKNRGNYKGTGIGSLKDGRNKVSCELNLPGRVGWVYEVLSDRTIEDEFAISDFFGSLVSHVGLQLKFRIHDDGMDCGEKMFSVFGEALQEAFLENP